MGGLAAFVNSAGRASVPPTLLTRPRLLLLQPGLLHERLAEHALVLGEHVLERAARREVVLDRVLVVGDADLVARPQRAAQGALAVHLHPVGAAEVAEVPHAVL